MKQNKPQKQQSSQSQQSSQTSKSKQNKQSQDKATRGTLQESFNGYTALPAGIETDGNEYSTSATISSKHSEN